MRCTSLKSTVGWVLLNVYTCLTTIIIKKISIIQEVSFQFQSFPSQSTQFFDFHFHKPVFLVLGVNISEIIHYVMGFPGGSAGKKSACNVGDLGSISGLERSPGEGNSYLLCSLWSCKELDTTERLSLSLYTMYSCEPSFFHSSCFWDLSMLFVSTSFFYFYFWLCWVIVNAQGFSLVVTSRGYSLWCVGFSLWWLLLLWSVGSRTWGLQQLWHMGLVAQWHAGPSWTWNWTPVPCIGRQVINQWITREVPVTHFLLLNSIPLFEYTAVLFIHFPVDGHLDHF